MKLVTIKEVADFTKVKEKTLYGWVSRGLIPCHRLNGLLRFNLEEIKVWVENSRIVPSLTRSRKPKALKSKGIEDVTKRIVASFKGEGYDSPKGETGPVKPGKEGIDGAL